ncbi:DUF5681 domain-containing protein [Mesorhizobium sp. 10J20-29]
MTSRKTSILSAVLAPEVRIPGHELPALMQSATQLKDTASPSVDMPTVRVRYRTRPAPVGEAGHRPASPVEDARDANQSPRPIESVKQAEYVVGYCRPPKVTQFKPGNNANPRGRPKGSKNHRTILSEELNVKVSVRENGRTKKMSLYQIGMRKRARHFADSVDPKYLLVFDKILGSTASTSAAYSDPSPLAPASKVAMLDWYFAKRMSEANGPGTDEPEDDSHTEDENNAIDADDTDDNGK